MNFQTYTMFFLLCMLVLNNYMNLYCNHSFHSCVDNTSFQLVLLKGQRPEDIKKKYHLKKNLTAPVKKAQKLGTVEYLANGKTVGNVVVFAKETVEKLTFSYCYRKSWIRYLGKTS